MPLKDRHESLITFPWDAAWSFVGLGGKKKAQPGQPDGGCVFYPSLGKCFHLSATLKPWELAHWLIRDCDIWNDAIQCVIPIWPFSCTPMFSFFCWSVQMARAIYETQSIQYLWLWRTCIYPLFHVKFNSKWMWLGTDRHLSPTTFHGEQWMGCLLS